MPVYSSVRPSNTFSNLTDFKEIWYEHHAVRQIKAQTRLRLTRGRVKKPNLRTLKQMSKFYFTKKYRLEAT
jgi:hypothetical protein